LLTDALCGCEGEYQALVAYSSGRLYFAQKGFNAAAGWSGLSNNAFWPSSAIYFPLIQR
jgi:hypothetical protein